MSHGPIMWSRTDGWGGDGPVPENHTEYGGSRAEGQISFQIGTLDQRVGGCFVGSLGSHANEEQSATLGGTTGGTPGNGTRRGCRTHFKWE
jgi:hypothetical protein